MAAIAVTALAASSCSSGGGGEHRQTSAVVSSSATPLKPTTSLSAPAAASNRVSGFGYKTAWLAFRGSTQQQVVAALGLSAAKAQDWPTAIRASYADNPAVAVTPPFHGAGGNWILATSVALLLTEPDVAALSKKAGTEVQYFESDRISETHGWARAVDGRLIRAFQCSGDTGELLQWVGRPDSTEQGFGLPDVARATQATSDAVFDANIDEEAVMTLAGQWSVNPQSIDGTPSPGDPLVGTMR
jgi:hypothetical protein